MDDPNGLVYYKGKYHLFYQHYPDSNVWGPMHWGHATSADLMHWNNQPIAIYPDSLGYIFSGSAVVDIDNTSKLATDSSALMVAMFTYHNPQGEEDKRVDFQTQGLAYSNDEGLTWKKYAKNPVILNPGVRDYRDPNVAWHKAHHQWVMALAVHDHIEFYGSKNLITWNKLGTFGYNHGSHVGVWECPDLFMLSDEADNSKWVLLVSVNAGAPAGGSGTQYFVGEFDGHTFMPQDTITRWIDYGADNYAGVTWSDAPDIEGQKTLIGWMSNWEYAQVVPTELWRSAMTIPRTLSLTSRHGSFELKSRPVAIVDSLRKTTFDYLNEIKLKDSLYVIDFDVKGNFDFTLANGVNEEVSLSAANDSILFDRTKSGHVSFQKKFPKKYKAAFPTKAINHVQIFVDVASVEVFINDGELVLTNIVFPTTPYNRITLKGDNRAFTVATLQSIW